MQERAHNNSNTIHHHQVEDVPLRVHTSRYGHLYMVAGALLLFLATIEIAIQLHGRRAHQHGPFHPSVAAIPRRLHFVMHSNEPLPPDLQRNVDSWKTHNPSFTVNVCTCCYVCTHLWLCCQTTNKLHELLDTIMISYHLSNPIVLIGSVHTQVWTPEQMHAYVTRHTPHLATAFSDLPSAVERTDLFRYILLWREGGIYSDVDVTCARPLEAYIDLRTDGLVVGWEGDWGSTADCQSAGSARTRLLVQWTMAAGPRHPVLERVLSHVAAHYNHTFSINAVRDTHERTGPVAWTDAVLGYAQQVQPGDVGMHAVAPPVVFLPRAVWGVAEGQVEVGQRSLAHQYLGSWKQVHR